MWSGRGQRTEEKQNIPRIKGIGKARSAELKSSVTEDVVISGGKAQKMLVIGEVRPRHWQFGHVSRAGSSSPVPTAFCCWKSMPVSLTAAPADRLLIVKSLS